MVTKISKFIIIIIKMEIIFRLKQNFDFHFEIISHHNHLDQFFNKFEVENLQNKIFMMFYNHHQFNEISLFQSTKNQTHFT